MIFGNKRSELEITAEILSTALNKINKTRLMYQTNLCNSHFKDYMDYLMDKEFIREIVGNPSRYYQTTDKGKELLKEIRNVLRMLK